MYGACVHRCVFMCVRSSLSCFISLFVTCSIVGMNELAIKYLCSVALQRDVVLLCVE